jgi:hypothetical protein
VSVTPRRPEESRHAKVLIHSPAGHGKTRLLGTAQEDPRTFPMAFLNFEGGEQSLAGLDIDVFDIRDGKDYDEVYLDLKNPSTPYRSAGVDSVTETQITMLLEILEGDTVNRADPDQLAQQDWGIVLIRMRRIIRHYVKMLPMHVFMTALSKDDVVAKVGSVKAPQVQGAFASELPGILDVVAYLALVDNEAGETERLLLLHSNPKFSVKTRTPWSDLPPEQVVPSEIADPTIGKLLDALGFPAPGKKQR